MLTQQTRLRNTWAAAVLSVVLLITGCAPAKSSQTAPNITPNTLSNNGTQPANNSTKPAGDVPAKNPDRPTDNASKNTTNEVSRNTTGNTSPNISGNGTNSVIPKPTGPTPLPMIAANSLKLVYTDNFSSNGSGWPNGGSNNLTYRYIDGGYQLSINMQGYVFPISNRRVPQQTNFVAEVTAKLLSSTGTSSSFGLVFQYNEEGDYYAFTIIGDRYTIWKFKGDENSEVLPPTYSRNIKNDGSANNLRVARLNNIIEISVNGERLVTVADDTLSRGTIGFIVTDAASAVFTDFKVYNFTEDYYRVAAPNLLPKTGAVQNIGTAGGTVSANLPGTSPGTLQIIVPKDAYMDTQPYQVTTQDMPSPNPNFVAGSPLITIESGGATLRKPVTIRIPITYKADEFPIVCEIDDAGNVQPTTTTALDKNSIGVTYYIFPKKMKLMVLIARNQTLANIEAQRIQPFKPGRDDWHFENPITFTSIGNCAGVSMTAIYYYNEIYSKGKGGSLYNRYLGNITDLDEDDRQAIRLVSLVQAAYEQSDAYLDRMKVPLYSMNLTDTHPLIISSNVNGDEVTYKSFVAAIEITRQPQLIFVYGKDKSTNKTAGHAMIVYGSNNGLLIADPNNPGIAGLKIPFENGKLRPYDTYPGNLKSGQLYDTFQFIGRGGAFLSWSILGDFWAKINDSSLGDAIFPNYTIKLADDRGKVYTDDIKNGANISVNRSRINLTVSSSENLSLAIWQDGALDLGEYPPKSHSANVELKKGRNIIGIYVYGTDGTAKAPAWTDFRWVTINAPGDRVYQITMDATINGGLSVEYSWERNVAKESAKVNVNFGEFRISENFPNGRLSTSTNGNSYQYNGNYEYYRHPSGPRYDPSWVLQTGDSRLATNSGSFTGYATIPWRYNSVDPARLLVGTQNATGLLSLAISSWRPGSYLLGPDTLLNYTLKDIFSRELIFNPDGETLNINGNWGWDTRTDNQYSGYELRKANYTYSGTLTLKLVRTE